TPGTSSRSRSGSRATRSCLLRPGPRVVPGPWSFERLPLGSCDRHDESGHDLPAVAAERAHDALAGEAALLVGRDRALVVGVDEQPDPLEHLLADADVDELVHRVRAEATPDVAGQHEDADVRTHAATQIVEAALAD